MFKLKDKSSEYIDTTGQLSGAQLKFGKWYLEHKILLRRIGVGLLFVWSVAAIGFSIFQFGSYLLFGYQQDQETLLVGQAAEFQNYEQIKDFYKAQEITSTDTRVFGGADGMYDFVAAVVNSNKRWIATLDYHFVYEGGETEILKTTLMPGDKRPVAAFGHKSKRYPVGVRFVIDRVFWQSVNPHEIFDVESYIKSRSMFSADNIVFKAPSSEGIPVPSAKFDLYNESAYSYWLPVFYVQLLNGNQTVGYIFLSIDQFRSGEKKQIDLRYFGDNLTVTDVRLIPVINFFDGQTYMGSED